MSDTSEEPSETTRLMSADRAQPRGPGRDGDERAAQTTVDENGEVNLRVGTVKLLNFRTPENFAVIYLKFKQRHKTRHGMNYFEK